jgi:hypothetical protein
MCHLKMADESHDHPSWSSALFARFQRLIGIFGITRMESLRPAEPAAATPAPRATMASGS